MGIFDSLLSVVLSMDDPHIATMHRMCTSVVQTVHILRATPPAQTMLMMGVYDQAQRYWLNRLLPGIPELPRDSIEQASLDRVDRGLGLVPATIVAIPPNVVSKVDTARAVSLLPGQSNASAQT
eukprot:Plantae.Rhodophyta-Palmaria_palmata.ctg32391.p3 GENE.Plantae.Rhodophyta-Palmaria_palmata.ctg32391~~Plantae.Rhodophyta-Palmaria_palmata.ctg32391.p3  ORF type:complete len:124 (-),score=2.26 Plantae.Rhodophyta-Palmaria_palmata.ctg32391:125-496(-)